MNKISFYAVFLAVGLIATVPKPLLAQDSNQNGQYGLPADGAAYADIADLVNMAPAILDVTIAKTIKVPADQAPGVPAHIQRFLIMANVNTLIRGAEGSTAQVKFLADIPKDARGKSPQLKKERLILLARNVPGRPGELQLVAPDAMIRFSETNDRMVRTIAREIIQIDAPSDITGITSAFYSPGTVLNEGETQIFLATKNRQPLSLSVISRRGQEKTWTVSTSELIEESATTPEKYTLLWYRLACGLPRALPPELVGSGEGAHAARAQADYKFVIDMLGPCGRKRVR